MPKDVPKDAKKNEYLYYFKQILVLVKKCNYKKRTNIHPRDAFPQNECFNVILWGKKQNKTKQNPMKNTTEDQEGIKDL